MSFSNINVDIIVPVYNAYEHLQKCVNSLMLYTDLTRHRVLLLNDCSTDDRVGSYLDAINHEHIVVVHNKTNLGFSANINQGISMSERDVVFLNSDTIVTPRWLEKIQNCAYTDETIATVTPLSNSATICSVPTFCEDNILPPGISVNDMAELVETCSLKQYPTIPVAHGFCMYVKRTVINLIGGLNAAVFQRGYGEENDFCFRAEEMGFHHVMCDDTFIYHAGTASFVSQDKKKLIQEHNKYLFENYPEQMKQVENYCKVNPDHLIQDNVRYRLEIAQILKNGRKTILYQVQSDFRENTFDPVGGTQLHVKDLAEEFRNEFNIVVVARDRNWLNATLYADEKELLIRFFVGEMNNYMPFRSQRFRNVYDQIISVFRVDMIHVHHVRGLTLELYYVGVAAGIPIITTLHDFYYICPNIKMLDDSNTLCVCKDTAEQCAACLKKTKNIIPSLNYINTWRKEHLHALALSMNIVVPSESTKQIIVQYYPELENKIRVIGHGLRQFSPVDNSLVQTLKKSFHIAFMGGVGSPAKGGDIICQLIKHGSRDIQWYVFGMLGHSKLGMLEQDNYTKIGQYERDELPKLLKEYEIDLVGILPIWPETFCYTLSESISCGVPVIAMDIGAVGERIHKNCCGWIIEPNSKWQDILIQIDEIRKNHEMYQTVKAGLKNIPIDAIEKMIDQYRTLYKKIFEIPVEIKRSDVDNRKLLTAWLSNQGSGVLLNEEESNRRLEQAETELENIKNSVSYKVAVRMNEINIPFKREIKAILYRLYQLKK